MPNYRRNYLAGGCYFFTVALAERKSSLLIDAIDQLRSAVSGVKARHPFTINAWVVLPEHMHSIWTLPEGDNDYPLRWRLIKSHFSRSLPSVEYRRESRINKNERGIWQRRYWEHTVKDEDDYRRCFDYIHYNPVKHGHVKRAIDWPYSTFHRSVAEGLYPPVWAAGDVDGTFGE
jgi:putative transposase